MNGLLVNSYSSHNKNVKTINDEKKFTKKTNYHTWPRKRKSKKRQIAQIINHFQRGCAISEINLKLATTNNVYDFLSYDLIANNIFKNNSLDKDLDQKRINYLGEYDIELNRSELKNNTKETSTSDYNIKKLIGDEINNCSKVDHNSLKNNISRQDVFNENKLGIIKILKNWKSNKNNWENGYQTNNSEFSDIRSSFSSLNTLNEVNTSDSISFTSDSGFSPGKAFKYSTRPDKPISSTHLIHLNRPSNLPPKPLNEQMKHQKEYEKMVEAIKKKERNIDMQLKKKRENRLKEEEKLAQTTFIWINEILPNWSQMKNSKRTQNLWWNGLPPCIRGKVWFLSIGNKLKITSEKYFDCVKKSKEILKTGSKDSLQSNESYEHSVELIRLDISRTFPHLCIFQHGGPYYEVLHSLLGAYVCYQPEIGYVQGMSFLAAVLLLNMEEVNAFICFANMLDRPCHKAFYSLNVHKMKSYYLAYTDLLRVNIYELYKHFNETSLSADLYLVDWVYTLFSKSMNLDLACRIWDLIIRDGETFIFRAALGIIHFFKNELLKMDFLRGAQYLTKLPDISAESLFKSISCIRMNNGSFTFKDLLQYYEEVIS